MFLDEIVEAGLLEHVTRVSAELFGSLGATGRGHGSDRAVLLGLEGGDPRTVDTDEAPGRHAQICASGRLQLGRLRLPNPRTIGFDARRDMILHRTRRLPFHPNAVTLRAFSGVELVAEKTYYSIGGGFVLADDGTGRPVLPPPSDVVLPHPFRTGDDLVKACAEAGLDVAELQLANEMARGKSLDEVRAGLDEIWAVMTACIDEGSRTTGVLPGGLNVRRRAATLAQSLRDKASDNPDPLGVLDWVSVWALAVNEQNAAGGRVVTAPTNGAAGIIPAVLTYAVNYCPGDKAIIVRQFLLAAGAVGSIFQGTASISGAEVGCQGEVGVATSMAAAGLCEILGGTPQQVSNAAEIGLEHHLGLTCDPVGGLVQVPCIERNAIGAITAITAARLALAGDGEQIVSLDQVIETMMATGADMKTKYKETSRGGLALSIVEC